MDSSLTRLHERAFDAVAKRCGNILLFNGRKAIVIASPIENELVQELVGYLPNRAASIEIKRSDFRKVGLTNADYVTLDGVVLRVRKSPEDASDFALHLVLHSTPDQPGTDKMDEGSVALTIGQSEVSLVFRNVDPQSPHVFSILYIENLVDPNPIGTFDPVPGVRTSNGRKILLAAAPDTINYILRWRVVS